ncbi:MAG: amidohydrolase family protein [Acidobacteriaceae bacterium]|nr:amidohydrolase family protein [Acidobacteriaceae bacterium]
MLIHRRSLLRYSLAGLGAAAQLQGDIDSPQQVPWSSGTERPKTSAPPGAANCHHHIYDSRFPVDPHAKLRPGDATVADYRLLEKRIGTTRNVIVQPSTYGVDNRCLLDALAQFGLARARGIAVVNTAVSDAELRRLDAAGVHGIRFNLVQAGATTLEMVEPLSKRVTALGWHIEVNASPEQIGSASGLWDRVPCPVVFDHLGHVLRPEENDPAFTSIRNLLRSGHGWVKLSGAYLDSKIGPPTYADRKPIAHAYVEAAPKQLVWGSDWPHPSAVGPKPDDAVLFDLLAEWAPDRATRDRILVDNAARLYGFS